MPKSQISYLAPIEAPDGHDLTLKGGAGAETAAQITVGDGDNGAIICTPGQPTGGEYFDVRASSLSGSAPTLDPFGTRLQFTLNGALNGHAAAGWLHMLVPSGNASSFADYIAGAYPYVRFDGSGVASTLIGTHSTVTMNGSGGHADVVDVYNTEFKLTSGTNYAGTVNLYHAVVPINASGATKPTNLRGILVDDLGVDGALATNTYAIRTVGDTKSEFGGPVTVGGNLTGTQNIASTLADESTSTTTGSLRTAGGLGVAKNIWCGQTLNFPATGTTAAVGIVLGTSNEAIFRNGAGNIKATGGGTFFFNMDIKPSTTDGTPTGSYDIGSNSQKFRNGHLAGTLSSGTATFRTEPNYQSSETGSNNAIACALTDVGGTAIPQSEGLRLTIKLAHTLQAGANTLALNGAAAKAIKSHRNPANDIGTAYAVGGIVDLMYDGTRYLDMSQ
jgi:hypothetical protein